MKRNERTSARVAKIAGKILAAEHDNPTRTGRVNGKLVDFTWDDIRALAASALTQTANKKPKPKRGKGAKRLGPSIVRRGLKRPRKKPGAKVWTG